MRCISGHRGVDSDGDDDDSSLSVDENEDASPTKNWARTRTLSISSPAEHLKIAANLTTVPKELTLDYAEISAVPPLPLWLLLAADQGSSNSGESTSGADSLFTPSLETHVKQKTNLVDALVYASRKSMI